MKKILIVALIGTSFVATLGARTINFTSSFPASGMFSSGGDWTSEMTFEVGSFSDIGTIPSFDGSAVSGSMDSWVTMPSSAGSNMATWDSDFGFYQGSFSYNSNEAPFTAGSSLYVWGYNSKALDVGSEWILLTDPSWTVLTADVTNPTALQYDISGTTTIVNGIGSLATADGVSLTSVQAIPEPSTYALIFGLGILGFLGYRRARK